MSKKDVCFETGLIAGVLGGVIAGLLFAPESGKTSRQKLKKAVKNFNEEYGDEIEKNKKKISDTYDLLAYNVERQFRKFINRSKAKKLRKAKELEKTFIFDAEEIN